MDAEGTAQSASRPPGTAREPIRVVYIAGFGRSGSTLLNLLLARARGLTAHSELANTWRSALRDTVCACGEPFDRCAFWLEVFERAYGGWDRVEGAEAYRRRSAMEPWPRAWLSRLATRLGRGRGDARAHADDMVRLYRAVSDLTGEPIIVDASKSAGPAVALLSRRDVKLHLVHLVRDSRATAFSWNERRYFNVHYSPRQSAVLWAGANAGVMTVKPFAASYLRLRYEDFVADPAGAVREILASVPGAPESIELPSEGEVVHVAHHSLAGNPKVLQATSSAIRLDDEWRAAMRTREKLLVTAVTWPLLALFGYPLTWRGA